MDYKNRPVRYHSLDIGWNINTGFGIQEKSIREAQATVGDNNAIHSLLRLTIVFNVSPSNSESGPFSTGANP